jgi:hypothetical protein
VRVGGQAESITVKPKGGAPAYSVDPANLGAQPSRRPAQRPVQRRRPDVLDRPAVLTADTMAVFTEVPEDTARELLRQPGLGELRELRGIQGGIENTNYFATTEQDGQPSQWVLTLFERLTTPSCRSTCT